VLTPNVTLNDLRQVATQDVLVRGRELAALVEDLDWDEYSLWGCLPGEGIGTGDLMVHHADRRLTGECPCPDGSAVGLCAHMAALALAYLGDDTDLADRLAAMPHGELVALVVELADRSAWARQTVWSRLA
jgi:hypothetical protein